MRIKWWVWTLAIIIFALGVPLCLHFYNDFRQQAELDEQIRLAKSEGIPVTAADYAAAIPPATEAENAAPIYRQIQQLVRGDKKVREALDEIRAKHTIAEQRFVLLGVSEVGKLLDEATDKPQCWFDRDWRKGMAVLMPEYATMKQGARVLLLRGTISAADNKADQAMADALRALIIAKHSREEGSTIGALVSDSIIEMTLSSLAAWSTQHPDQPQYRATFDETLTAWPRPDLRRELRDSLMNHLSIIELCATPAGRHELGLRDEDASKLDRIMPIFLNQQRAKVEIVKAERDYWRAISGEKVDEKAVKAAVEARDKAMIAFPTALDISTKLTGSEDGSDQAVARLRGWKERKERFIALGKGLKAR